MGVIMICEVILALLFVNSSVVHGFVPSSLLSIRQTVPLSSNRKLTSILSSHASVNQKVTDKSRKIVEFDEWNNANEFHWDDSKQHIESTSSKPPQHKSLSTFLNDCFIPSGDLTIHYYRYVFWRAIQRFVNATNNVFGTQALLLALGVKKNRIGVAAATTWVLKDALGKLSRIMWASSYGRRFDLDAKKWRFRSGIINAVGNGLEVLTYLYPSMFLVTAALANALKQMSMLTSSSTRNTIYKAFSKHLDNIGDITAKGEAQIAIIDLFGMVMGISVSKSINASQWKIVGIIIFLSLLELYCVYHEIRSVVYHNLNYERTKIVLQKVFKMHEKTSPAAFNDFVEHDVAVVPEELLTTSLLQQFFVAMKKSFFVPKERADMTPLELFDQLSPEYVANVESLVASVIPGQRILKTWSNLHLPQVNIPKVLTKFPFSSKKHHSNSNNSSSSSSHNQNQQHNDPVALSAVPEGSHSLGDEKFAVLVNSRSSPSFFDQVLAKARVFSQDMIIRNHGKQYAVTPQILLNKQAQGRDLFRAFIVLHHALFLLNKERNDISVPFETYLEQCLEEAHAFEKQHGEAIMKLLEKAGWDMHRFAYGSMRIRVQW